MGAPSSKVSAHDPTKGPVVRDETLHETRAPLHARRARLWVPSLKLPETRFSRPRAHLHRRSILPVYCLVSRISS